MARNRGFRLNIADTNVRYKYSEARMRSYRNERTTSINKGQAGGKLGSSAMNLLHCQCDGKKNKTPHYANVSMLGIGSANRPRCIDSNGER